MKKSLIVSLIFSIPSIMSMEQQATKKRPLPLPDQTAFNNDELQKPLAPEIVKENAERAGLDARLAAQKRHAREEWRQELAAGLEALAQQGGLASTRELFPRDTENEKPQW